METYDKSYDRVNVKNERPLLPVDRIIHTVTTSDDPVIRKVRILCTLLPKLHIFEA